MASAQCNILAVDSCIGEKDSLKTAMADVENYANKGYVIWPKAEPNLGIGGPKGTSTSGSPLYTVLVYIFNDSHMFF